MIAIIAIVLIIINIIFPKTKLTYYPLLVFMWLIMAFTYHIADESVYLNRYNSPYLWNGQSELLFSLSVAIFRKVGFDYVQYKAIMSVGILLLISLTIRKYAKYPNIVLVLYFLCPFALNVAQLRNALATAVFIFGSRYLFEEDETEVKIKRLQLTANDLRYIAAIIIATMFHTAAFIWIVLLIAKKFSLKINVIIAVVANVLLIFVLTPQNIIRFIPKVGAVSRMTSYLTPEYANSEWRHYSQIIWVLFVGVITISFSYFRLKKTSKESKEYNRLQCLLKSNIIILFIIGIMLMYTQEVYRLQEGMSVINYLLITNCINEKSFSFRKISIKNIKVLFTSFIYSLGMMYFEIIHYLIQLILRPILNNNCFFDLFK